MKVKKQFRLYDVYRYAVENLQDKIQGISWYRYELTTNELCVKFENGEQYSAYLFGENALRRAVHDINKINRQCKKPGKRSRKYGA